MNHVAWERSHAVEEEKDKFDSYLFSHNGPIKQAFSHAHYGKHKIVKWEEKIKITYDRIVDWWQ